MNQIMHLEAFNKGH